MVTVKVFLGMIVMGASLLHAELPANYAFLNKITDLEQHLLAFTKYQLLHRSFPTQSSYVTESEKRFEVYETSIRQVTIDLNGRENHTLLTRFIDAKNGMKELVSGDTSSEELPRLIQAGWILQEDIYQVSSTRILALAPAQRVLHALTRMEMLLEGMALDHVLLYASPNDKKIQTRLHKRVTRFEASLQRCTRYAYWRPQEREQHDRIVQAWSVLKKELGNPKLPLVIEIGSDHLSMLIRKLKQMHESEHEG